MSIPLDRLYQYVENVCNTICGDTVIYRFWPHGSKNLENLTGFKSYSFEDLVSKTKIICADQEPLMFDFYEQKFPLSEDVYDFDASLNKHGLNHWVDIKNFKGPFLNSPGPYILLHSEQRSSQVSRYMAEGYRPVYYWSHAVLALDWFRYAKHVKQQKNVQTTFLIYNRAWGGTREYRLKFSELMITQGLEKSCKMNISAIEPELDIHYNQHRFSDSKWRPVCVLENHFPTSTAPSHCSADFDLNDYESTDIEVVLETLFDDARLHLTEKALRPIACGQPFIMVGPHGSLEYLRSYGFQTFETVWDESYDQEPDAQKRMEAVTDLMKQIAGWHPATRKKKMAQAKKIVAYNKKYLFSDKFLKYVVNELVDNLQTAFEHPVDVIQTQQWIEEWKKFISHPEVSDFLKNNTDTNYPNCESSTRILNQLEKTINKK
jgi:hypothetical protein